MKKRSERNVSLRHSWLLSLYAIIPIALVLTITDQLFLNGIVRILLPYDPQLIPGFNVIFIMPHILASSFSFLDVEYMHHYFLQLIPPMIIISLGVVYLPSLIGHKAFQIIYSIWTIIHVIGQQFGISLLAIQRKTWLYSIWRWTGIVISIFIYFSLYMPYYEGMDFKQLVLWFGGPAFLIFGAISFFLSRTVPPPSVAPYAQYYIWFNFLLVFSCWILFFQDYPFLVNFVPRFIHDFSAFMVYMNHDHNRSSEQSKNLLYTPLLSLGVPAVIQNPLFAIGMGYLITQSHNYWVQLLSLILTFLHYYTDSFSWQRNSPHRKYFHIK